MRNIILPCLLLMLAAFGCSKSNEDPSYSLPVHNNAKYPITVWCSTAYPDTTIPANPPYACSVDPTAIGNLYSSTQWDKVLNGLNKGVMFVFIVNKDTLNKYGAPDMKQKYRILKRLGVTKEYLNNNSGSIVYP